MSAAHFGLGNLTTIVDNNSLQIDGPNCEVMTVNPIDEKFRSFGWNVVKIDGHNFSEILRELDKTKRAKDKPTAIIAQTVKGKGAPCAENNFAYHGVALSAEELKEARKNLIE